MKKENKIDNVINEVIESSRLQQLLKLTAILIVASSIFLGLAILFD